MDSCCEFALRWILQNLAIGSIGSIAWYRPKTHHYLSQCWPSYVSPYGVTMPQWAKLLCLQTKLFEKGPYVSTNDNAVDIIAIYYNNLFRLSTYLYDFIQWFNNAQQVLFLGTKSRSTAYGFVLTHTFARWIVLKVVLTVKSIKPEQRARKLCAYFMRYIWLSLKTKGHQFDNFVVTGGNVSCRNDNLRCHHWRQIKLSNWRSFVYRYIIALYISRHR